MKKSKSSATGGGRVRSIGDVVPSALAALEKTIRNDLPYEQVPKELLSYDTTSSKLDLSQWSLVLTDDCIHYISTHVHSNKLLELNLSGAENIADGLFSLSRCIDNLESLNFDNAYRVTSEGLSAVTKNCGKLTNLSLNGCMGISGSGFGILGQNCRELVHLSLAANRQITQWAFLKIFESCKRLQSLDISFCSLVTDQEIKVLAETATGLRKLNLRDCKLVSDVGLTFLSQGCAGLSEINIRRSEMPFRVTDVALLQLGHGCPSLRSINLHGCEMITDTGLSWISQRGKELRHIDLSNCSKVTNSGARHIGEGCAKLRSIVLVNLSRVSDVGIRCLATLPHLEALNGSGLRMLSDGVDRSFGKEGLQALGDAECSAGMKHLNLHGCSLISTLSMKSIANFPNLETLDLSRCTRLSISGAKCVGKTCRRIRTLSLASCGDCISDGFLEALVANMNELIVANLSFCTRIGERSMKAFSCEKLHTLNLTGCTGITDQAILHLSEGDYSPGLRHLHLAQCSKVSDTALSWIMEGFKQTLDGAVSLETLSLKGTRITPSALKGIRDRFQYSTLKSNATFLGFWPLSRTDDRKVIKHYHERACAAATIQARVRTMRERDTLMLARQQRCKQKVAILVGALFRGGKARIRYKELKLAKKLLLVSSLRLQGAFRCRLARKRLNRKRELSWLAHAPRVATKIQRRWRGIRGRRRAEGRREEMRQEHVRRVEAAVRLQVWCRVLAAKNLKQLLLCERLEKELNRFRAAIVLQCTWRTHKSVERLKELKAEYLKQRELERLSALRIEASFRTILFKKAIRIRVERARKRLESALTIQCWYRQEQQRIADEILARELLAAQRLRASIKIQARVRQRLAYIKLVHLRLMRNAMIAVREAKATVLCRWGRICVAKIRTRKRREEFDEEVRRALLVKIWAASKITALCRGKLGRDEARKCRVIRAQRWKELWSVGDQRKFYYNQDTGETRWRKPQCILDLEPKPKCKNCPNFLAEVECDECQSHFCSNCFDYMHGPDRVFVAHHWKTVYDYYGRRKDYDQEPWMTFKGAKQSNSPKH